MAYGESQCSGMAIDILKILASSETRDQVLADYPYVERRILLRLYKYAAWRLDQQA